ncbi:Flp family type IVb pilin [Roseovarius sp. 2305UL8-3]|uniref:Flp family type IVb pilin n=1 Tax=Roseovarius conchicola TaxID=3121636 RepID=UPI0035292868
MSKFINTFLKDEDGAVTVDWVVLTAAIVGLGVAGIASVQTGITGLASEIGTAVNNDGWVGEGSGQATPTE